MWGIELFQDIRIWLVGSSQGTEGVWCGNRVPGDKDAAENGFLSNLVMYLLNVVSAKCAWICDWKSGKI